MATATPVRSAPRPAAGGDEYVAAQGDSPAYRFMNEHSGLEFQKGMWTICRKVDGEIVAAVAYTDFHPNWCNIHIAGVGQGWLSRKLLFLMFDVPFRQWGLTDLIALPPRTNKAVIGLASHMGFDIIDLGQDSRQDTALVYMRLSRADCRWLGMLRRPHG